MEFRVRFRYPPRCQLVLKSMMKPILPVVGFAFQLIVQVTPLPLLVATSSPISSCPQPQIQALIHKLRNSENEQEQAIAALSQCSNGPGSLIWELQNGDAQMRSAAGEALSKIGTPAVIDLFAQLENNNANAQMRSAAGEVLSKIGTPAVIDRLTSDLDKDGKTHLYAAKTLGQIGWKAESAVQALIDAGEYDDDLKVNQATIQALTEIVEDRIVKDSREHLPQLQLQQLGKIYKLQTLLQKLDGLFERSEKDELRKWEGKSKDLIALQDACKSLRNNLKRNYSVIVLVLNNFLWVAIVGILFVLFIVYHIVLVLRPLMLLEYKVSEECIEKVRKQKMWGFGDLLGFILEVSSLPCLRYRLRVLDAWVEKHISKISKIDLEIGKSYICKHELLQGIPVPTESENSNFFKPEHYAKKFQEKRSQYIFLIWGECGTGKTSLARQCVRWAVWGGRTSEGRYQVDKELVKKFHRHRMIPFWIAKNFEGKTLVEFIKPKLAAMIDENSIDTELVRQLLRKQRILVIVDHYTGMDSATHKQIDPSELDHGSDASVLIITSRDKNILSDVNPTCISPWDSVEFGELETFLEKYTGLTDKNRVSEAAEKLKKIVKASENPESQGIKIALVTLYADQMIKHGVSSLPDNIPELTKEYLNLLNAPDAGTFNFEDLLKVAGFAAWKCLHETYVPKSASKKFTDEELKNLVLSGSKPFIEYFNHLGEGFDGKNALNLIQIDNSTGRFFFKLGFLAEYLAAFHLVSEYENDKAKWNKFLEDVKKKPGFITDEKKTFESSQSFFQALCDWSEFRLKDNPLPGDVQTTLKGFAGWKETTIKPIRDEVEKLQKEACVKSFEESNSIIELDPGAIERPLLSAADELRDPAIRILKAGLYFGAKVTEKVLQEAWQAVENKPLLVWFKTTTPETDRLKLQTPPEKFTEDLENLPDGRIPLKLVQIPAGKFCMGSKEGEGEENERPQHEVQVSAFWMGQYPVTQAQWLVVAKLEQVKTKLKLDPSYFTGDDLPVERVSWEDAIEFCARLSKKTGKVYRLPSEAEWEYACRATTETPYHFGDTITEKMANFSGRAPFKKTTPVGFYGGSNAFGLYDMHGNVWEWSDDLWYNNYEGAPSDGKAWQDASSKENIRLLRGGSWLSEANKCRSAYRNCDSDQIGIIDIKSSLIGFRVVCDLYTLSGMIA